LDLFYIFNNRLRDVGAAKSRPAPQALAQQAKTEALGPVVQHVTGGSSSKGSAKLSDSMQEDTLLEELEEQRATGTELQCSGHTGSASSEKAEVQNGPDVEVPKVTPLPAQVSRRAPEPLTEKEQYLISSIAFSQPRCDILGDLLSQQK